MSTEMTQDNESVEMNTANTRLELTSQPEARMNRKPSEEYSATRTLQAMKESAIELFAPVSDAITILLRQNKGILVILGWALLAMVGLRILSALLDAINDLPLIPILLELIGIAYIVWFVYRYLMKANTRQELVQQIDQIKQDIVGNKTENTTGIDDDRVQPTGV